MTLSPATLVRSSNAEHLEASSMLLLADSTATGGALTTHRSLFLAGKPGAPPHLHHQASELFYVLGGSLRVLVGEEISTLEKGDLLVVPPEVPHAFEAAGSEPADVFFVLTNAKPRFDYYRLLERVYRGEADPAELGASGETYDNQYVESLSWTQRSTAEASRA